MATKRQSQKRFEQLNHLVDVVFPSLPQNAATHRNVLMVAFRHAGPTGGFTLCNSRIAEAVNRDVRSVRRTLRDLEAWGLVRRVQAKDKKQIRAYQITYKTYRGGRTPVSET